MVKESMIPMLSEELELKLNLLRKLNRKAKGISHKARANSLLPYAFWLLPYAFFTIFVLVLYLWGRNGFDSGPKYLVSM